MNNQLKLPPYVILKLQIVDNQRYWIQFGGAQSEAEAAEAIAALKAEPGTVTYIEAAKLLNSSTK